LYPVEWAGLYYYSLDVSRKETVITILIKEVRRKRDTYIGEKGKIDIGYPKRRHLLKQIVGKAGGIL
jgi:hypothetical protein